MEQYRLRQQVVHTLGNEGSYIFQVAGSAEGSSIAVCSSVPQVKVYDRKTLAIVQQLTGHKNAVKDLVYSPAHASIMYTASTDGSVGVWDTRTSSSMTGVYKSGRPLNSLSCNSDGTKVIACANEGITLWDTRSGKTLRRYDEYHGDLITQVSFHHSHPGLVVSGSEDGTICYYNTQVQDEDDALETVINVESAVVRLGLFGPEGHHLYCVTGSETFSLWDMQAGTLVGKFDQPRQDLDSDYLIGCQYNATAQGLFLLTGKFDGRIGVSAVHAQSLVPIGVLSGGHTDTVRCFHWDWSNGPGTLITGGEDSMLSLWSDAVHELDFGQLSSPPQQEHEDVGPVRRHREDHGSVVTEGRAGREGRGSSAPSHRNRPY